MEKIETRMNEKNKENGITLIALVITIIVLLILAGISVATLTGDNGVLTKSTVAKEQTEIGKEKEIIALAYNSARVKKASNLDNTFVKGSELNSELTNQGAYATGNNPITVIFDSGRKYTINSNGKIEQDVTTYVGTLRLTYKNVPDGVQIYLQTDEYDKAYYDALTEYAISSENFWAIDNGDIEEGTVWSSITDVIHYWGYEYNSLKEFYEKERSNEYNSCGDMLLDRWDLGYKEYIDIHGNDDYYEEYAQTIYNQVQSLLPQEYFVTVTCNGVTQIVNLAEIKYAEFEIAESGDYPVHAVDNQNNSEADINVTILPSLIIEGNTVFFEPGMNWSSWIDSSYSSGIHCEIYTYNGDNFMLAKFKGIEGIWCNGLPLLKKNNDEMNMEDISDFFVLPTDSLVENAEYMCYMY